MEIFTLDAETFPIRKGLAAPPPVCYGWCRFVEGAVIEKGLVTCLDETAGDFPSWHRGPITMASLLKSMMKYALSVGSDRCRIVNVNMVYDFAVLASHDGELLDLMFDCYDAGLIEDPSLREQLLDIASGHLGWSSKRKTAKGTSRKKEYSLKELADEYLGIDMDKSTWRTGYGRLAKLPLAQWPQGAIDYAVDDSEYAGLIWWAQRDKAFEEESETGEIPDSQNQAKYHFGLHLASVWGIRTDPKQVYAFKAMLLRARGQLLQVLKGVYARTSIFSEPSSCSHNVVESKSGARACRTCGETWEPFIRPNGKKNLKAIKSAVYALAEQAEVNPKLTKAGIKKAENDEINEENLLKFISTKAEDLEDLLALHERETPNDLEEALQLGAEALAREVDIFDGLTLLSWYNGVDKLLGTYMPALEQGTTRPINARYKPLVETGRASCARPNLMNLPKAPGVRECYVPRPGFLFCSVDYEALELHTLAQVCLELLGESSLADALNQGLDPHLLLAVEWLIGGEKLSYDEAKKIRKDELHPRHKEVVKARNLAKAANFGLPGGLGAQKFKDFCKASGTLISLEEAKDLKEAWFKQWPEMRKYFKYIQTLLEVSEDDLQYVTVEQVFSERIRGKARYTAACNSYFQGLAADGAKLAVYELSKACYRSNGTLKGSRLVVFVHDETIMEHPDLSPADRHARCMEQSRIMIDCMLKYTPDVRPKAEPALMPRWYKEAAAKYDENGYLRPWTPEDAQA